MFNSFNFRSQRTLIFSALFFGLAGAINLFDPVDLFATAFSNKIRMHDASGDIVVVSLDDYVLEENISSPLRAENANEILDALLAAGAEKIVLTDPVLEGNGQATLALQETLEKHGDRIFLTQPLASETKRNPNNSIEYVESVVGVHSVIEFRYWRGPEYAGHTVTHKGQPLPAAERILSYNSNSSDTSFKIDYAVNIDSIPRTFFERELPESFAATVRGKKVFVGIETAANASRFRALGINGWHGRPTMVALAAETLNKDRHPLELHWFWSLAVALLIAHLILTSQAISRQFYLLSCTLTAFFLVTICLNSLGISFRMGHSLLLILVTALIGMFRNFNRKKAIGDAIHPESGLASINALRMVPKSRRPLIVAEISGFDEVMGILSPDDRRNLAKRISTLATSDEHVWHGESGHFYWFIPGEQAENLSSHLDSLSLIMRNGFSIGKLPISLNTVFGVDLRYEAELPDRILGAKLSAKRAEATGQSWLAYEEGDKMEAAWSISRLRELDLAINAGQIRADLQPKVDLKTGEIVGVEALARWTHPIRGRIRPDEFVKAAEEGKRIKELTIAVMHSAISSVGPALAHDPNFMVSVNITPSLLMDPMLCGSISSVLALYQMSTANLILEVTESTAFSDNEACIKCMHDLVAMGITLSIDDYGTGNSTLEYMRSIPARELKIDRTFVSHLLGSEEDRMLVRSTIQLAHKLNMTVVAEGVEDTQTLESLKAMGCDQAQGYLISRPLSPENFLQFLDNLRGPPVMAITNM